MIRTPRLELVNATAAHLRAELEGREALASALGASVPASWPPELYDADATRWGLARLEQLGAESTAFHQYWFVRVDEAGARTLIGVGGFKGDPKNGEVELGYGVLGEYQRVGYATEATAAMLGFAFGHEEVTSVVAHTLPHLTPSIGVLEKTGFRFAGQADEEGMVVVRVEISLEEFARRRPVSGAFAEKLSRIDSHWTPKRIARVNDTEVKAVRIQGEFVWHSHANEDEMFVVLAGRMLMQFRDHEQWIGPGECIVVPHGVEHRPVAPEEVQMLLIEPTGTLNTGNVVNERTVAEIEAI